MSYSMVVNIYQTISYTYGSDLCLRPYGWKHVPNTYAFHMSQTLWLETQILMCLRQSYTLYRSVNQLRLVCNSKLILGTVLLFRYNKLVWRPMVSDTVYVPTQGLLTRRQWRLLEIYLKSTCDVNLLSKLSIIFKEWRVMNNVDRGEVIVLFILQIIYTDFFLLQD